MVVPNSQIELILATSRFGLGAGLKDMAQNKGDPRAYLRKQIQNPKAALLNDKDLPPLRCHLAVTMGR